VSPDTFLETIEAMTMIEKYYTPDQLKQLEDRREAMEKEIAEAPQKWAQFHADLKAATDSGMDPTDPKAQELARRGGARGSAFTGGDEGIYRSLRNMYQKEPNVMGMDTAAMKPGMDWLMKAAAAAGIKVPQ